MPDKSVDGATVWDGLLDEPRGVEEKKKKKQAVLARCCRQKQSALTHRHILPAQTAERHPRVSKGLMRPLSNPALIVCPTRAEVI